MRLYAPPQSYKTRRLLAVAQLHKKVVTLVPTDYTVQQSHELAGKNAIASLPTLEVDGRYLTGCATITRYLSTQKDSDELFQTLLDDWLDYVDQHVEVYSSALYLHAVGALPTDEEKQHSLKRQLGALLQRAEEHLKTNKYLVGEQLTAADIALFSSLIELYRRPEEKKYEAVFNRKFASEFSSLTTWIQKLCSEPCVQKEFGKMPLDNRESDQQKQQ